MRNSLNEELCNELWFINIFRRIIMKIFQAAELLCINQIIQIIPLD